MKKTAMTVADLSKKLASLPEDAVMRISLHKSEWATLERDLEHAAYNDEPTELFPMWIAIQAARLMTTSDVILILDMDDIK